MNYLNAQILLAEIKDAAVQAGIYDHWFLSFGTMLGAVRPTKRVDLKKKEVVITKGFIQHDDDMDVGILRDNITREQEADYVRIMMDKGLFNKRERHAFREDDGRHCWCSLRRESPPVGTRCCNWFWFEHNGFLWHSKGKLWVSPTKIKKTEIKYKETDEALALGIKASYFRKLVEVDFEGGRYNIPLMAGSVLDTWYPGWAVPKSGGASGHKYVLRIPKWSEPKKWVMAVA